MVFNTEILVGKGTNTPTLTIRDYYASAGYGAGIEFIGANGGQTVILTGPTSGAGALALYTANYASLLLHIDSSGDLLPNGYITLGPGMYLQTGGGSGAIVLSGTGAPTANYVASSIFQRTDGAVGSRIYISQGGGSWTPIAGV